MTTAAVRSTKKSATTPTVVEFVTDVLGLSVSPAQRTLLKSIYGLPLDAAELDVFRQCTGRASYPGRPFAEVTVVAGARSGKDSRIAAPVALFEALHGGHEARLARGERGVIPLVAQDARAAKVAYGYVRGYATSPALAARVETVLADEIALANGLTIAIFPCTLRSLRGWSMPAAVMDEVGFYRLEGAADSDVEVQSSIRRGMIAFPSTRLVKISTPYMKSGVLYDDFQRAWGQDDPDLLVWQAPTALMNPTVTGERLEQERRLDPTRFSREYLAEFAEDLAAFLPAAWIDAAVAAGCHERPPADGIVYTAAVDASGGGKDAFTLAVAHAEGSGAGLTVVQDVMRAWTKPRDAATNLEGAVGQVAEVVKRYGVKRVHGDRYARGWVREAFARHHLSYVDATSDRQERVYMDKSAAFLDAEPLFATGRIRVLDHPTMLRELRLLERRPQPGGKDRVDHPRGSHDDHANALALAAAQLTVTRAAFAPIVAVLHRPTTGERAHDFLARGAGGGSIVVRTKFGTERYSDPRYA